MEVNIVDNFFSNIKHQSLNEYCLNAQYVYGEVDSKSTPPTGMVHDIIPSVNEFIYNLIDSTIKSKCEQVDGMNLYRMYINCFAPSERPYFHTDGNDGLTFLYYPNMEWDKDEGGETQFLTDRDIYGVIPLPNRMVFFNADIWHRATSFRNNYRFTIAAKYR
tara:strand:+ start:102 stop:587 length:486 start_codon:yes stop_codon:yes gene_type:complete